MPPASDVLVIALIAQHTQTGTADNFVAHQGDAGRDAADQHVGLDEEALSLTDVIVTLPFEYVFGRALSSDQKTKIARPTS
jgi:hypothetical protein